MKMFCEFLNESEGCKLEVSCFALKVGEVEEIIPLLEGKGFELTYIDGDSVYGKKEGNYQEITGVMKELKEQGFSWGEKE